jgi:L-fuconolactonase
LKSESVRPAFDRAFDLFGADRLMFGGDWPVSLLSGGYSRVWSGLGTLFDEMDVAERGRVLGGTAEDFYGLDAARLAARARMTGE